MRYSDIKAGYVYYADLEPVRKFEFGQNHMSIVLRKGHDKKTVTVISLTSKENGVGVNKLEIGILSGLPQRLISDRHGRPTNSYVVLDQVRTISASRISEIKNGRNPDGTDVIVEYPLDSSVFEKVICAVASFQMSNLKDNDAVGEYHKGAYFNYCVNKVINLVYSLIKGQEDIDVTKEQIRYFYAILKSIDQSFSVSNYLSAADKKNKIAEEIDEIVLESVD